MKEVIHKKIADSEGIGGILGIAKEWCSENKATMRIKFNHRLLRWHVHISWKARNGTPARINEYAPRLNPLLEYSLMKADKQIHSSRDS